MGAGDSVFYGEIFASSLSKEYAHQCGEDFCILVETNKKP